MNEFYRGFCAGLEAAATEIDCGGTKSCREQRLKDGTCILSVNKDCPHDESCHIRAMAYDEAVVERYRRYGLTREPIKTTPDQ